MASLTNVEKQSFLQEKKTYLERAMAACEARAWIAGAMPERYGLEAYNQFDQFTNLPVERLAKLITGIRLLQESSRLSPTQEAFLHQVQLQQSLALSPFEVDAAHNKADQHYQVYCS